MQEEFYYKAYITEALGGIAYGEDRPHWKDMVMFLHEKEEKEKEVDVEAMKKDFVQRFNKEVKR